MRQDAVCKSENPIRPLSDDRARQVFPHSWNFPSQPSGPGTRGSLQVWAGFSKVNITFKTSTFHTWDLLSVNWILTGWGLDYVNRFNAWRAFGLFSLKLKCVCALMSVMIVDVVQEKRYRSDFWVQLQLRQQLCNFQNNDTVSISLQCCGGWGGFCREAVAQTLRREWSWLTTSRSIQFHAPGAKLLLALAAALFRVSPLCGYYLQGKTINSQIQHPAVVGSEPQPMPIANMHQLLLFKLRRLRKWLEIEASRQENSRDLRGDPAHSPVRMSWLMPSTEMVAFAIPRPCKSRTTPLIPRCTCEAWRWSAGAGVADSHYSLP